MKRCYFKGIAESTSIEAEAFRNQHPEINYKFCRNKCSGYSGYLIDCQFYKLREMDSIEEEEAEDSSLEELFEIHSGGFI